MKIVYLVCLMFFGTVTSLFGQNQSKERPRPNVLFLQTDQHVWYALEFVNSGFDTPNLRALANDGMYFSNAMASTPSCSPARATMITGMYPHSNSIINNLLNNKKAKYKQHGIEETKYLITENILFDEGYYTAHFGKWHVGKKKVIDCYKNSLLEGQSHGYHARKSYNKKLAKAMQKLNPKPSKSELWGYPLYQSKVFQDAVTKIKWKHKGILATGRTSIPAELLPHTSITNETIRTIKEKQGKPWMITTSWHPPHIPWAMPEPYFSKYDRKEMKVDMSESDKIHPNAANMDASRLGKLADEEGIREYLAIYRAQVYYMDEQIGRIIKTLKETGQYDNTLIIFTSDHGDTQGRFGTMGKSLDAFYNEVVRIPLVVKPPKSTNSSMQTDNHQVNQIDFMPTILDYAGFEIPNQVQGRSLRPLIEKKPTSWRAYNFSERTYPHKNYLSRMVANDQFKYVYYSKGPDGFYDLKNDPKELQNLINEDKYKAEIEKYRAVLKKWMKKTNDEYLEKYLNR